MNGTTWARWAPASALVYGVLYVVGMILIVVVGEEVDEKADADMLAYYADSGNRTNDIIGLVLVAVSLIFFLFFVSALRERLREADAEGSVLSGVAAAAGAGAAVLFLAGAAAFTATALGRDFIDEFEVDPNAGLRPAARRCDPELRDGARDLCRRIPHIRTPYVGDVGRAGGCCASYSRGIPAATIRHPGLVVDRRCSPRNTRSLISTGDGSRLGYRLTRATPFLQQGSPGTLREALK
jgi:hypothetical protein